jgi:hypothetical protein
MDSLFSFSTSNLMMELCGRAPPERMTSQLLLLRRLRRTSISLSLAQQKTYIHANPPKPERNNTIHAIKTHPKVSNTYRPNQTYTRDFGCCLPIYTWYTAHLALPFSLSLSLTSGDNISPPGGGIFHHPKTNIQLVRLRELLILHDWAHLWAGMIKKKKNLDSPSPVISRKIIPRFVGNEKKAGLIIFVWELLLLLQLPAKMRA